MSWRRVFLALVVALAGLPGSALGAGTAVLETSRVAEVPTLAGETALWAERTGGRRLELWQGMANGEAGRVQAFSFEPAGSRGLLLADLAASPSLTLLTVSAFDSAGGRGFLPSFSEHHLGATPGPLERIAGCAEDQGAHHGGIRSVDVWGEAFAYRQCDGGYGHVEVRDQAAAPLSPARSVGEGGFGVRIAGRYLAWLEVTYDRITHPNSDIVVYDRAADAVAYRLRGSGAIQSLDVQEDGKIAIGFDPGSRGNDESIVGWASPQEPRVHRLPLAPRRIYDVRIVGDRIAFQREGALETSAEIGVANLEGDVRWVARRTDAHQSPWWYSGQAFDYDGQRFVWRELGCEERRVVIRDADAPGVHPGGAAKCPLELLSRPTVDRGWAGFQFGCGAFEPPCYFNATLWLAGDGTRVGRVTRGRNPVWLKLSARARRLLRQRGTLRVRAKVTLIGHDNRYQVRRATIRLRAG